MLLKKLALCLLIGALSVAPARAGGGEVILPVIMYHEVKPANSGKDAITPQEFESDLKYLLAQGYTAVTASQLASWAYGGEPLPEKPVMLTFDDGYLNNYVYVLPLLREYGVPVVLSPIGKNADDFSEYPGKNINTAHATWEQLAEMDASGLVELQNHTYDLHSAGPRMGCLRLPGESLESYERLLTEDVLRLQAQLYKLTGRNPCCFAYPYGKYSEYTDDILRELGIRVTLTCDYGVNILSGDPEELFRLKRVCRSHNKSAESLLEAIL